ncbi:MAG: hypothetical protein LBQ93_10015 [Treponema sp.]|jgi:DNA-binding transcriptional regulator YiaG|nr:hypothetical protein [Treponema sp.]
MEWKGKYKSELLMVCHMDAQAMHKVGAISDKEMLEYDRDCLVSSPKPASGGMGIQEQKPAPVYAGSRQS